MLGALLLQPRRAEGPRHAGHPGAHPHRRAVRTVFESPLTAGPAGGQVPAGEPAEYAAAARTESPGRGLRPGRGLTRLARSHARTGPQRAVRCALPRLRAPAPRRGQSRRRDAGSLEPGPAARVPGRAQFRGRDQAQRTEEGLRVGAAGDPNPRRTAGHRENAAAAAAANRQPAYCSARWGWRRPTSCWASTGRRTSEERQRKQAAR